MSCLQQYILVLFYSFATADIYLHNPRGSNNRLNEATRPRTNANRMFNSENNNRGGYNVGSLYYYSGSKLQIEWTNQHSCSNPNANCEVIIQYMCDEKIRDGVTTQRIPSKPEDCQNNDCNTDLRYGMHETWEHYRYCQRRERNQGLFTADQKLKGVTSIYTRQNANGNAYGYECTEERDYYPHWAPSPWRDIIVMTNNATRCPYYQSESQNVKSRWMCVVPDSVLRNYDSWTRPIPHSQRECEAFKHPADSPNATYGVWTEVRAHGIPAPECRETVWTRDNHLGNTRGGYTPNYNWTIPDHIHENCVLRIRYNISTNDYESWDAVDHRNNKGSDPGYVDLSQKYGFPDQDAATERGYEFKNNNDNNNLQVQLFPGLENFNLRLAVNTNQYGRTFQDRTHAFAIRERPSDIEETIQNLNVRGKRGNIVQVYPAVEYDFVPNTLMLSTKQHVHFQWTGSNTNPNNNDGEGLAGTDRSNVVQQGVQSYLEGSDLAYQVLDKHGHWGRSYPDMLHNTTFAGLDWHDRHRLAFSGADYFRGSLDQLNDAGTYFDLGPRKVTSTGIYHYLCTRNNNFSNRSQKGRIICTDILVEQKHLGVNGGELTSFSGDFTVTFEPGVLSGLHDIRVEHWDVEQAEAKMEALGRDKPGGGDYASRFFILHPEDLEVVQGKSFTIEMDVDVGRNDDINVYHSTTESFSGWTKLDVEVDDDRARFKTSKGGIYVAMKENNLAVIIGATIGSLAALAIIITATVCYCRKRPQAIQGLKRSVQKKV